MPVYGHAQEVLKKLIQISGVTLTADSLRAVPFVTISVKNQDRGVISNEYGIFGIVCEKGDTLHFTAIGFRDKDYVVNPKIEGHYFNLIQLMVQDTFYLPETIVRPIPYGDAFDYAFKHTDIPDDQLEAARRNMSPDAMARASALLPRNGRENQSYYQMQEAQKMYYYGQRPPMNILNPLSWAEFINAWKRGDFRKKY
jgi:hypothetical protein